MLNFLRTGMYERSSGDTYLRTDFGLWWTDLHSGTYSNFLHTTTTMVNINGYDSRGFGLAIRCVVREG